MFCGYEYVLDRNRCPAWAQVSKKCSEKNHFVRRCKKTFVYAIESDEKLEEISMVRESRVCKSRNPLDFKLIVEPCKDVEGIELSPSSQSLVMWNGTKVKPVGLYALPLENP